MKIMELTALLTRKPSPSETSTVTAVLMSPPIWTDRYYARQGLAWSTLIHALMIAALVGLSTAGNNVLHNNGTGKPILVTEMYLPEDIPLPVSPGKNHLSGGGGGGDRDELPAPRGKLPKFSMQQITPPAVVIRNEHPKLPVEPTVIMPPDIKLPFPTNLPSLGDPMSKVSGLLSNGPGSGGGIGSGSGGGVGSGEGGGVGPGSGGGFGGGVFRVGGGVSAPRVIFAPEPDYSEEARKAKYQGTVILWMVVGSDGRPRQIRIARTLGMGLDEKAIQAVQTWRFEPALREGRPVAVQINVEVTFRLY